jgi:SAM-dependent methyltransferase
VSLRPSPTTQLTLIGGANVLAWHRVSGAAAGAVSQVRDGRQCCDASMFDRAADDHVASFGPCVPHLLEIGCGTGHATVGLTQRGWRVLAVELGTEMAAVARRSLVGFLTVQVVTLAFEDRPLPLRPFDLVFAATAFHWVDPDVRVRKAAAALRVGGHFGYRPDTSRSGREHSVLRRGAGLL